MILDAEGLKRGNRIVASSTEEKIYETLGHQQVAEIMRDATAELTDGFHLLRNRELFLGLSQKSCSMHTLRNVASNLGKA
jgi:hypothetical protein